MGQEEEDPVNASQNAELSFLNTVWTVNITCCTSCVAPFGPGTGRLLEDDGGEHEAIDALCFPHRSAESARQN